MDFSVFRYVKSDQAVLIMNICVTLTIAMAVFVVGVDKTSNQVEIIVIVSTNDIIFEVEVVVEP